MAGFPHEPLVVEVPDDFTRLPEDERLRLTDEWLASLRTDDPAGLPLSGAEMVAEARAEEGLVKLVLDASAGFELLLENR
jgi:hypothetical protein